jgi:hypothetical protein
MATTRVVVHVGPMKTGTTAIGAYFSAAHAAGILPSDVIYPAGDLWFPAAGSITKHGQLADYLYPEGRKEAGRKTAIQAPDDIVRKVRDLAASVAKGRGSRRTAVFISETLVGRANLGRLVDLLKSAFDEVVFVLAVRSPVEATQSLLVHKIKEWRSDRADLDLYGMLKRPNGSVGYDYRRMLLQLHELPIDDFFLIPYFEDESDGYAVVDRFMKIVTGKPATRLEGDFGSRRIHPSLPLSSLKRLVALKKLKPHLERIPFLAKVIHSLFLRILNADRSKVMRAGFYTRSSDSGDWVISPDERARIVGLYGNLGDDLRKALGPQSKQAEWRSWFKATGI